jgi:hypothetical protein
MVPAGGNRIVGEVGRGIVRRLQRVDQKEIEDGCREGGGQRYLTHPSENRRAAAPPQVPARPDGLRCEVPIRGLSGVIRKCPNEGPPPA